LNGRQVPIEERRPNCGFCRGGSKYPVRILYHIVPSYQKGLHFRFIARNEIFMGRNYKHHLEPSVCRKPFV
jgi:hypothetical protein